jgi:hypothetical protein
MHGDLRLKFLILPFWHVLDPQNVCFVGFASCELSCVLHSSQYMGLINADFFDTLQLLMSLASLVSVIQVGNMRLL